MNNTFSTSIYWSDEDDGFIALVPEFPGLSAFGETREEAAREASDAIDGFVQSYNEDGKKLPEVRKIHEHSGNIRLRLPRSLHTALANEAVYEDISLNSLIMSILSEWVGKRHSVQIVVTRSAVSFNVSGAKWSLPTRNDFNHLNVTPKMTLSNTMCSYATA